MVDYCRTSHIYRYNLVATGSPDGLLGVALAATAAGLCAGGLIPGGLVGRGGTAALSVNIIVKRNYVQHSLSIKIYM